VGKGKERQGGGCRVQASGGVIGERRRIRVRIKGREKGVRVREEREVVATTWKNFIILEQNYSPGLHFAVSTNSIHPLSPRHQ
jgi:hypothetical protein